MVDGWKYKYRISNTTTVLFGAKKTGGFLLDLLVPHLFNGSILATHQLLLGVNQAAFFPLSF